MSDSEGIRPLADAVKLVDGEPYFAILEERFGVPIENFESFLVHQPNVQTVWLARRDLAMPVRPEPYVVGTPFFYVDMRWPRPTTASAIRWGALATKNRVDLRDDEIEAALALEEFRLDEERAHEVTGTGYVLLRHHGAILGLGFYRRAREDDEPPASEDPRGVLRSILPRSWGGRLGVEPPPVEPPDWRTVAQPTVEQPAVEQPAVGSKEQRRK